ncbi:MAG: Vitamin epoxide reductase family protein [Candidatus Parcubacteria bacterium]|nr:Vitamin epoxide reductase family protein [Candidatus Parcubacteria bacterium]
MNRLKRSLTLPLNSPGTAGVIFLLVVALIGFADAAYLTVEHYQNVIPPCTTSGCEAVLTSAYSVVLGVPVSLGGAIYYLAIAIGALIYLEAKLLSGTVRPFHLWVLRWTLLATVLGLAASVWFFYLQALVIHSYCQYCLGSATTSTLLFITAAIILAKNGKMPAQPPLSPSSPSSSAAL